MANFTGTNSVVSGVGTDAIRRAISAYSDQEYTDNLRIAGTALVGSDARISTSDEDYYGSIRWTRTLGDIAGQAVSGSNASGFSTAINIATEDSTEGQTTDVRYDSSKYIKTMRTMGAEQYNVTQVLSQAPNAIEKVSRDFGVTRARDADAALLAMLRGVALEESRGASGQVISSPRNDSNGFYFETAASTSLVGSAAAAGTGGRNVGAALGTSLYTAMAAGFGDLEPDFMYLVTDVETFQAIRAANLVDENTITDGNVDVQTMLSGKIRVMVTQSLSSHDASGQTNIGSTLGKTSYLMLPGALYQHDLSVPNPVAFDQDESVGGGAGEREIWYRWGNIYHPRGYSWEGRTDGFVINAAGSAATSRSAAGTSGTGVRALVNTQANQFQGWERKETVGNLGILPIFHA